MNTLSMLETAFLRVLHVSWQAALLVVLIVAAQRLLRGRISPAWRHALWGLLLVRLLLIWTVPAPVSLYNAVPTGLPARITPSPEAPPQIFHAGIPTSVEASSSETTASLVRAAESGFPGAQEPSRGGLPAPLSLAAVVWLAGAVFVLAVAFVQSGRLAARVAKRRVVTDQPVLELLEACKEQVGVSTWLALIETPRVKGPALFGTLRPRLLLPLGLLESASHADLRHVLLHELAHLKRADILVGWLFDLLLAAHWFNPVLWWARRRIGADRELACDAHVLSALDAEERPAYGHALLDQFQQFARPAWCPGLTGVLEGKTKMERRITMITQFKSASPRGAALALAALLVLGTVALTDAQEPGADVSIRQRDIIAHHHPEYGAMLAARITNAGPKAVVVDVSFYAGEPGPETFIQRGGLEIPAGKTGTEAVPWPVQAGEHSITAVIDPDNAIEESDESNNRATRSIVCKMVPEFTYELAEGGAVLDGPIEPGRGLRGLGVGDTAEAIKAALGAPEARSTERWLTYRKPHGIDFYLGRDGRVVEMRFNPGYAGQSVDGVGIGDSLDTAIEASGGAKQTVRASNSDTHGVAKGTDCVLYEKEENGRVTAHKFIDAKRGVLYWADASKRITQIVAFAGREKTPNAKTVTPKQ